MQYVVIGNLHMYLNFRDYDRIIIVFRDPFLRAMSPSNGLVIGFKFNEQKIKDEWFMKNFAKHMRLMMPAWKIWFEEVLQKEAEFCLINYDEMKVNLIKELNKVANFLGYEINEELEQCILKNQEGKFHRPENSKDEIKKIMSTIPPGELETYLKMEKDVLEMLKNVSSC